MTATIAAADAQSILNHYISLINAGTTNPQPRLLIYTANYGTLLATFNLESSAFGSASLPTSGNNSVSTASDLPKTTTASGTGLAGSFRLRNRNNVTKLEGTGQASINTGGSIVVINKLDLVSGESVELIDLKLAMPTLLRMF